VLQVNSPLMQSNQGHGAADALHVPLRVDINGGQDGLDGCREELIGYITAVSAVDDDILF
jgi:hypothetical protein